MNSDRSIPHIKKNEYKKTVTAKYDQSSQNCEKLPPIVYHVSVSVVLHRHEMKISPLSDFMLFHLMLLWMVGFSSRLLLLLQWYSQFVGKEKKMWMMKKKTQGLCLITFGELCPRIQSFCELFYICLGPVKSCNYNLNLFWALSEFSDECPVVAVSKRIKNWRAFPPSSTTRNVFYSLFESNDELKLNVNKLSRPLSFSLFRTHLVSDSLCFKNSFGFHLCYLVNMLFLFLLKDRDSA